MTVFNFSKSRAPAAVAEPASDVCGETHLVKSPDASAWTNPAVHTAVASLHL